ncbi:hypothetical protein ACFQ3S_00200 [Mucilaginibacter terrae]|uniref:hypothetical protein n=1 Tax=Mucilaginibacter terrae TaxID=1955052 RepID=UPI003626941B
MKETDIKSERDLIVMDFNLLDKWDDFEDIVMLLEKYFSATITKRVNGPESKFVTLIINKGELILINNPYGNTLKASNDVGKAALMEVYSNWDKFSRL